METDPVDVLVVVDTTGSMDIYLYALQRLVPELEAVKTITSLIDRIGILSYKDFIPPPPNQPPPSSNPPLHHLRTAEAARAQLETTNVLQWSGWNRPQLGEWVKMLEAEGGGDYPEAAKSALWKTLQLVESDRKTIVLWYTDAPPHHKCQPRSAALKIEHMAHAHLNIPPLLPSMNPERVERNKEEMEGKDTSGIKKPFYTESVTDWVYLCKMAASKNPAVVIHSILPPELSSADAYEDSAFYVMLAEATNGSCSFYSLPKPPTANVVSTFGGDMENILTYSMGTILQELNLHVGNLELPKLVYENPLRSLKPSALKRCNPPRDKGITGIALLVNEEDSEGYLPPVHKGHSGLRYGELLGKFTQGKVNLQGTDLTNVRRALKRYENEGPEYREKVRKALLDILENGSGLNGLNRTKLVSLSFEQVLNDTSLTSTAEALRSLANEQATKGKFFTDSTKEWIPKLNLHPPKSAQKSEHDPQLHVLLGLDPVPTEETVGWIKVHEEGLEELRSPSSFLGRREAFSELGSSCRPELLRSVGNFARFLEFQETPPSANEISIPLVRRALEETPEHFFQVLPHLLHPYSTLSTRSAKLLAAVYILSGASAHIEVAQAAALKVLNQSKGTWLIKEEKANWSSDCARLLLALDKDVALSPEEHTSYLAQQRYEALYNNLDSKVSVSIGWTPFKTRQVGDWKDICGRCGIRRSITMMHDGEGACGMCIDSDKNPKDWLDKGELNGCWVECSETHCKAQYVIEDEEGLRIPPRCYYCRKNKPCPWIECSTCGNRTILPKSYRTPTDANYGFKSPFVCPPCQYSPHTSIRTTVHKLVSFKQILEANNYSSIEWVGLKPFAEIFRTRSTFSIFQIEGLKSGLFTLVPPKVDVVLKLFDKRIMNIPNVVEQLEELVEKRLGQPDRIGKTKVFCGLLFVNVWEDEVGEACGNDGCTFKPSIKGLKDWYKGGKANKKRRELCPSCWRKPSENVLAVYLN